MRTPVTMIENYSFPIALANMNYNSENIYYGMNDGRYYCVGEHKNLFCREKLGNWFRCESQINNLMNQIYCYYDKQLEVQKIKEQIASVKTVNGTLFTVEIHNDPGVTILTIGHESREIKFRAMDILNKSFSSFKLNYSDFIPIYHLLVKLAMILREEII